MIRSHSIFTDSGGVQKEAPSPVKIVLRMRDTTECPDAPEADTVRLVGEEMQRIVTEVPKFLEAAEAYNGMVLPPIPYGEGNAFPRIVDAIQEFLNKKGKKQYAA